jgi:hypothetical protein
MKTLRIACLVSLLLALWPAMATPAQAQTVGCRSKLTLTQSASINGAIACFTVTAGRGSTALRLDLTVTSGSYDLYVKAGNATSLTDADRVNVSAASSALSYVLIRPGTSPYTVAVVRTSRSGSARLSPVTYQARLRCSGATCTATYPLTSMPGSRYGDQAIFPVPISKAGRVSARVTWRGTARLSALLYGPSASKAGIIQSSLARKDGASPLALAYDVRSNYLTLGGKWSVALNNASRAGGTVTAGELSITYPQ